MDKSVLEEAIRYISGELNLDPNKDKAKLIDEASQKFDLNPLQTEFLLDKYVFNK